MNSDMRNGVRRLAAEACPMFGKRILSQARARRNNVVKITRFSDDPPYYCVYMIYTRDRWEDEPNLQCYRRGLEAVRDDMKMNIEREISTILPPLWEETNTESKALEYLEGVCHGSGIQVKVFHDDCIRDATKVAKTEIVSRLDC